MQGRTLAVAMLVAVVMALAGCAGGSSTMGAAPSSLASAPDTGVATEESTTTATTPPRAEPSRSQAQAPPPPDNTKHDEAVFLRACAADGYSQYGCKCMVSYLEHPNENNDRLHNVVTGKFDANTSSRTVGDWIVYEGSNATDVNGGPCLTSPP